MLFHLHIEKTGGKSIESNIERIIGSACCRAAQLLSPAQLLGFATIDAIPPQTIRRTEFVTGHYTFGMHSHFQDESPHYISLIRDPVSRLKSYYNYILNSPMYEHKDFLLENGIDFPQFALGEFDQTRAPIEIRHLPYNGQTKMIAGRHEFDSSQEKILKDAMNNMSSVQYSLFTTARSTEAYFYILKHLGRHPFHRYSRRNTTNFDFVGSIDRTLRKKIEANNEADTELFRTAVTHSEKRDQTTYSFSTRAALANQLDRLEKHGRKTLDPRLKSQLRRLFRKGASVPAPATHSDTEGTFTYVNDLPGEPKLYVLPGDTKSLRYITKSNWNDITHRLWKLAAARSDLIVDAGSNYGEFLLVLNESLQDHTTVYSVEANPYVMACQEQSVRQLDIGDKVKHIRKAVSSRHGETVFFMNSQDTGNSSLIAGVTNAEEISCELITVDSLVSDVNYAMMSLKIDVEGHDLEVLKGASSALKKADFFFVTLEMSPSQWFELTDILDSAPHLSDLRRFIYVYDNLFEVGSELPIPDGYGGNFDLYLSSNTEVVKLMHHYAQQWPTITN